MKTLMAMMLMAGLTATLGAQDKKALLSYITGVASRANLHSKNEPKTEDWSSGLLT